jgi:hypothetical protein
MSWYGGSIIKKKQLQIIAARHSASNSFDLPNHTKNLLIGSFGAKQNKTRCGSSISVSWYPPGLKAATTCPEVDKT